MATKDNNPAFNFQILASDKRHEPSPAAGPRRSRAEQPCWGPVALPGGIF